jgi:hypothetical protein
MKEAWTAATPIPATFRALVAFVVLAAQVGAAGAGILDAGKGVSTASHFEDGGTNLHFAHNEADCFLCRAQHLDNAAPFDPAPEHFVSGGGEPGFANAARGFARAASALHQSRAPPQIV